MGNYTVVCIMALISAVYVLEFVLQKFLDSQNQIFFVFTQLFNGSHVELVVDDHEGGNSIELPDGDINESIQDLYSVVVVYRTSC